MDPYVWGRRPRIGLFLFVKEPPWRENRTPGGVGGAVERPPYPINPVLSIKLSKKRFFFQDIQKLVRTFFLIRNNDFA